MEEAIIIIWNKFIFIIIERQLPDRAKSGSMARDSCVSTTTCININITFNISTNIGRNTDIAWQKFCEQGG